MASKIKNTFKEIFYFFTSTVFLKNALGILALLGGILLISVIWMRYYTHHGETYQVKNYVGMQLEDVLEDANDKGFQIAITDSVFLVGKPGHEVLEQNPQAMSRVKENRTIYLRVTKKIADMKTLPTLSGGNDDYNQYSRLLKALDMDYETIGYEYDNKLAPNTILHVVYKGDTITEQLRKGFDAPMGAKISFVVTKRGASVVTVPKLVCERLEAAEFLIRTHNLTVGSVIKDATVTNESRAYVWRQVPDYTESRPLRIGEQINVYLTQHKPEKCGGKKKPKPKPEVRKEEKPTDADTGLGSAPVIDNRDQLPATPETQTPVPDEEEEGFGDEFDEGGHE